jgi:hypothetical protein
LRQTRREVRGLRERLGMERRAGEAVSLKIYDGVVDSSRLLLVLTVHTAMAFLLRFREQYHGSNCIAFEPPPKASLDDIGCNSFNSVAIIAKFD